MAITTKILNKVKTKAADNSLKQKIIAEMLITIEEGKQGKRTLDKYIKTI